MRVDFNGVLNAMGNQPQTANLKKRIQAIAALEPYTLLTPPYESAEVKRLMIGAQDADILNFHFPNLYYWLMLCFDGGLLFTNQLFSLNDEEDLDNDLIEANLYYRDEKMIPEGWLCIGRTNYGAFIVLNERGQMGLWDLEAESMIREYPDLYAWLDDVLAEARYLLDSDALFVIEDPDDADEDDADE